jgi:hypothetical protein
MACCGQRRREIRIEGIPRAQAIPTAPPIYASMAASAEQSVFDQQGLRFQYVGKTALAAIGLVSGRQYRFASPGAILQVDPRDRASLAVVPNLRQL